MLPLLAAPYITPMKMQLCLQDFYIYNLHGFRYFIKNLNTISDVDQTLALSVFVYVLLKGVELKLLVGCKRTP